MCIAVFLWKSHTLYPFLLLLNRDEYHNRRTTSLGWWDDGEILGERDEQAGGTWLACSKQGKLAFLTNVRELSSPSQVANSRGDLPIRLLKSIKGPKEFAEELVGEAQQFNGFFQAQRLRNSFEDVINKGEISVKEITESLMKDTTKDDDKSKLPQIYPPEFEYQLSAIFIDAHTAKGRYGTRSISAVVLGTSGDVCFYERSLEKDMWKERMTSYQIEKERAASPL